MLSAQEDTCADAESNITDIDCSNSSPLAGTGTHPGGADPEAGCLGGVDITWWAFSFDQDVIEFGFDDLGNDVALYTGNCGSLTEIVCQGNMLVTNIPGDIFFVAAVNGQDWEINLPAAQSNEECNSATNLSGSLSGESNICASGPTGDCTGANSVWYAVDVTADGTTLEITVTPGSMSNPMVSIYDACGGNRVDDMNCTDVATAICLFAGNTYFVEVSTDAGDAGTFDIEEVQTQPGPAADVCSGAVDMGTLDCGFSYSENGDPFSCPDGEAVGCMVDVIGTWYTFTTATDMPQFTINSSDDFELFEGSCGSLNALADCSIEGVPQVADASLTYFLLVDGNGSFNVETPVAPANEESGSAIDATGGLSGESNLCASVPTGSCPGDNSVWYTIDVATDGSQLEVTIIPSGTSPIVSPSVSIYDAGGTQVDASGCADIAIADCLLAGTYSVEVTSAAADAGEFDLVELSVTGPLEDNCSGALPVRGGAALVCGDMETVTGVTMTCPDADASGCMAGQNGTWYTFTTDASLPDFTINSSDNFELFEGSCGSLNSLGACIAGAQTADPSLTYFILVEEGGSVDIDTPTPPDNTACTEAESLSAGTSSFNNCCLANPETWFAVEPEFDGVTIDFTQGTLGSSVVVDIFEGCGGPNIFNASGDFSATFPTCSEIYYVRVTTTNADCGDYSVGFEYASCTATTPLEDICSAAVPVNTIGLNMPLCLSGCAQFSCVDSDCGNTNGLWFAVDFSVAGSGLNVEVNPANAGFEPVISIFEADCNNNILSCEATNMADVSISSNLTYFIEISSAGIPGDFDVCFTLTDIPADCASWNPPVITRPENPDKNQDGPFCPGETINFCFAVDFIVANPPPPNGNGCQWLQGVIPVIGDGWDLDATPLSDQSPGDFPDWHEDVLYSPHPPPTTNPVLNLIPNANDPNGVGLEYGNGGGLSSGDLLPGGWYGTTATGGSPCDGSNHPNGSWGINAGGCNATPTYDVCFDLTVKQFDSIQECEEADLSISVFAMADGMTGCWTSTACANDEPGIWTDGMVSCDAFTELMAEDVEICSGEPANVLIETINGATGDIYVYPVEEGETTGAEFHEPLVFDSDSGTLLDEIENTSGTIQVVTYEAYVSGENCDGPPILFEVTVFPEIEIEYPRPIEICPGETFELLPIVRPPANGPYTYDWRDANGTTVGTEPSIVLPYDDSLLPGPHFVQLIVTDRNDCTQEEFIDFELIPSLMERIDGPTDICISGNAVGTEYCAVHEIILESEPLDFNWTFSAGVVLSGDDDEPCINIDESATPPGTYNLTLAITDRFDCIHDTTIVFTLSNGPVLKIEPAGCVGDQIKLLGINTNHTNVPSFLHMTQASGPNGTLIAGDTLGTGAPLLTDTLCILTDNYTDTLRLYGASAGGCAPPFIQYIIPPAATPMFTAPMAAICENTSVTMSIDNPTSFTNIQWTDGTNMWTTNTVTETPSTTTTYTWTAINAIGCEVSEQFTVTVNPLPQAEINGSTTFCAGEETDLTATTSTGVGPFTYLWSNSSTDQTITVSTGPSYTVTITDANLCTSEATVTVSVANMLTLNVTFNQFCEGDPDGATLVAGNFDSYQWFDASGAIAGETNSTYTTAVAGSYYVEVTQGACTGASDPVAIAGIAPLPPIFLNSETVCNEIGGANEPNINLDVLIPPTVQGFWRDEDDLPVGNSSDVSFIDDTPGAITYTFITTNAMAPCVNDTIPLEIVVEECGCPAQVGQLPSLCGDGSTPIDLNSLTSSMGTWSSSSNDLVVMNGELLLDETTSTGSYTLTFTHDDPLPSNCTLIYGTTFEVFQPLTAELDQSALPCNSMSTGEPTNVVLDDLIISGDASGTWETNDARVTIVNGEVDFNTLPVGPYNFTYRLEEPGSPCGPALLPVVINVRDCSCPVLIMNVLDSLCNLGGIVNLSDSNILNNPDGLQGMWTMSPDIAGALLVDQFDVTDVPEGDYTFTYMLNNPIAGCDQINSVSQSVYVSEQLTAMVDASIEVCNGVIDNDPRPIELDLDDHVDSNLGQWIAPSTYNGGVIDDINKVEFLGVDVGEYTFVYELPANGRCAAESYEFVVSVASCNCPVYIADIDDYCSDEGMLDLNSLWQDPAIVEPGIWQFFNGPTDVRVVNDMINLASMDGRYQFSYEVTNAPAGCDPILYFINVDAQPEITITAGLSACNEDSSNGDRCINLNMHASGAPGIWIPDPQFPNDASDITNICFDDLTPGDIWEFVFQVPNNGLACDTVLYTLPIVVQDCGCPNITIFDPPALCEGDILDLTTISDVNIVTGQWTVDNSDGNLLGTSGFIPTAAGMYTLTFTPDMPGAPPCEPDSRVTFQVTGAVSAGQNGNLQICDGEASDVDLIAILNGNPSVGGNWSAAATNPTGGTFDDVTGSFNTQGATAGTYEFLYVVSDDGPCIGGDATVTIDIESGTPADAGDDMVVSCDATATLGGDNPLAISFMWTSDNGAIIDNPTAPNIDVNAAGTYTLEVTDANGCTSTSQVVVTSDGGFDADFNLELPDCGIGLLTVTTTGATNNVRYSIDGGATFQGSEIFDNIAPGTYTLVVEDDNGCRVTRTFTVPDANVIAGEEFAGQDRQVEIGEEMYQVEAAILVDPSQIASVTWIDNEDGTVLCMGTYEECGTIEVNPDIYNQYCVTLVDVDGCEVTDCVILREQLVRDVYIPNVFNPTTDNPINQTFFIQADRFVESIASFNVFDRWGELVFSAEPNSLPNDPSLGWNGRWNNDGAEVEQGVYVYVIKVNYTDVGNGTETETFAGDITIFR